MLLEPFRIETVAHEHAGGLAAAAGRYGEEWTRSVVDGWFGPEHPYGTDLYEWVDNRLSGLCEALRAAGEPTVARLLVAGAWRRMDRQLRLWTSYARPEARRPQLEMLSSPLVRLLEAADDTLRDEITGKLREYGDNVVECLMPALRLPDAQRGPDSMRSPGTARSGSTRSSRGRRVTRTTGRSHGPDVDAASATRSGRSSAPGRDGSSNGRWRRTDAGTCTPESTRPGCRCDTRPGGRGVRTRWC
jgi:hypothetical protein